MSMERAALRGQIEMKKHRLRELKLEASGLTVSLRDKLGPWISLEAIEIDLAVVQMDRLNAIAAEAKQISDELETLEDALNG